MRILKLWTTLWAYIQVHSEITTKINVSPPTSVDTPASMPQLSLISASIEGSSLKKADNYPLLLTAPDAYFKEAPSTHKFHEERKSVQEQKDLARLEYFRRQRVEITLADAVTLINSAMYTGMSGIDPSKIADIDGAHADLSREILLWLAESRPPVGLPCVPLHPETVAHVAIPLCMAEEARIMLEQAETCTKSLKVGNVKLSRYTFDKGQTIALVPLSVVVFRELLYLRGWEVTEDHMPRPLRPVMVPLHHIWSVRPTRRRLHYAPSLPPLEQDYSFGMDAGRISFEAQMQVVQSRRPQRT